MCHASPCAVAYVRAGEKEVWQDMHRAVSTHAAAVWGVEGEPKQREEETAPRAERLCVCVCTAHFRSSKTMFHLHS